MTKSVTCPEELGGLASQVTVDYGQLAHQGRLAAATAEPEEVRSHALWSTRGKITYSYERFNTSRHISLCNCVPETSDWNISLGLHSTPKNAFGCIHSRADQSQCLLFFDMTLLPQSCSGQCEIKEKYTPPASIARNTHSFLKACLCIPEDSHIWKPCTNMHTALINILYITGCWKPCWLP